MEAETAIAVAQVIVGAGTMLVLAAPALTQEAEYVPPEGTLHVLLLAAFAVKHLPSKRPEDWVVRDVPSAPEPLTVEPTRTERFRRQLTFLINYGAVPSEELLPRRLKHPTLEHSAGSILIGIMSVVLAPIAGLVAFVGAREVAKGVKIAPIVSSIERSYNLTQFLGVLTAALLWVGMTMRFAPGHWRPVCLAVLGLPVLGLLTACIRTVLRQQEWKRYWAAHLETIMQHAEFRSDHDLFMRASYFLADVQNAPDIPLTGVHRTVIAAIVIVQILMLGIIPLAQALWSRSVIFQ